MKYKMTQGIYAKHGGFPIFDLAVFTTASLIVSVVVVGSLLVARWFDLALNMMGV